MPDSRQDRNRWLRRRRQLTRRYRQCLDIGPERCDLQAEIVREEAGEDWVAQWLRFNSEPGERVPGLLVRPAAARKPLPLILVLPGGHRTKDLVIFGHEAWPLPFAIESPHHRFPVEKLLMAPRPLLAFEGDSDFPREGVQPMLDEAREKYALLDAADRFRSVWYSGGHGAYLRDPATLEEIGGWFARHLS